MGYLRMVTTLSSPHGDDVPVEFYVEHDVKAYGDTWEWTRIERAPHALIYWNDPSNEDRAVGRLPAFTPTWLVEAIDEWVAKHGKAAVIKRLEAKETR